MALRIQVLGHGLIPRALGLAPRLTPFPADQTLCYTILNTNGLSIKFIHPETGNALPLTKKNLKRMFELYDGKVFKEIDKKPEEVSRPTIPETADKFVAKVETPVVETKEEIKEEVKVDEVKEEVTTEETKEETSSLKPINKPEDNKNNYQKNNNNNNNNKNYQNNKK